ncbi:MAG TPA: 2,3-epoxybenzoyl-CoA dihydrolase [Candidatus Limnocylindrales bacterium]
MVSFDTEPGRYRHWRIDIDAPVATLTLKVDEHAGLVPGYELKQNSYDLGVDIELHDAVQRLRFEHPEVRAVVVTGGLERIFCAGANIRMLAQSDHSWKVNFCKFTNETRNAIEDASLHSGQTYLAALNGTAAGGGYEIALACERILLVDDNSSAVSMPEVSLLGVLPGTGGLTRVTDKRGVRKDLADVFATRPDGVRGKTALAWGLVDEVVPRARFDEIVRERALAAAERSSRPAGAPAARLEPLQRNVTDDEIGYGNVTVQIDRTLRCATLTIRGPGTGSWMLDLLRELDDAILLLRHNELEIGTWVFKTEGDAAAVASAERRVLDSGDWLSNEIRHFAKRVLKRLDVTSRSLIAVIEPGSCFAGVLLELALACDRQYMLDDPESGILLTDGNFHGYPMGNGLTRLESRFYGRPEQVDVLRGHRDRTLSATEALELGLVTEAPDDIDWEDEIRLALEQRAALSPDALTGMEANHRFVGPETVESKVFGRLAAWQNWIFTRPNASGPDGALLKYGTGQRASFDRRRV